MMTETEHPDFGPLAAHSEFKVGDHISYLLDDQFVDLDGPMPKFSEHKRGDRI